MTSLKRSLPWRRWGLGVLCAAMVLCVLSLSAQARVNPLDGQPSIRKKHFYLKGRHTVAPGLAFTVGDAYSQNVALGVSWRYFVASWLGVGIDFGAGAGIETGLAGDINDELSREGKPFQLSTTALRLTTAAMIELVPFQGKFLVGKGQARIAFHVDFGFGMALVSGTGRIDNSISLMPVVGAGMRIFPAKWFAIGMDVRDHIVNRVLSSKRDGSLPAPEWGHNWMVTLSVGFFFPTELGQGR